MSRRDDTCEPKEHSMSGAKEVRSDRLYTQDHEWAKSSGNEVTIGISAFAVDQLGDITLVDLTVVPGDVVSAHQVFGTVESVKTLSDLFSPVAGRVLRINEELSQNPELANQDPWEKAWMIVLEPETALSDCADLMDSVAYARHLEQTDH